MNAVGIDVSKGRSTVAILRPMGEVVMTPEDVCHDASGLDGLAERILSLEGDTKVLMEATGRYHEAIASELHERGIFVSVVNPILIHHYNPDSTVRKVKTDKKDSVKIAKYCLEHWNDLREYSPMDTIRQQLKLFSRQYNLYMKNNVSLQNNLISLSDKTFPGVDTLFSSPERADGHQKWVDFFTTFWHVKCVTGANKEAFVERYQKWCRRNGYNFSASKASEVYDYSLRQLTTLPKSDVTKLLIQTAAKELTSANELLASLRQEMNRLARQLPEYDVVRAMYGVGDITAAQLIAEIGDVRRFPRRSSIVGFAGVDPEVEQSGKSNPDGKSATKRGSPHLRKTLYQIMTIFLQRAPAVEPVYKFLDRKRSEGKPYNVYMTAGANKFLRIYYARVKERLQTLDNAPDPDELNS